MSGQQSKKVFEFKEDYNGSGRVVFSWSQDCSFIAVCGESKIVYVLDKRGRKLKEIQLTNKGKVLSLEWDKDNEIICILQEDLAFVSLWNVFGSASLTLLELDSAKAKSSFAKWSKTHPVLVVGTDKGALIFYNKKNQKKIPTVGKHAKKVITGDWNKEGLLITGGEDKILTVSNFNSDTMADSVSVKMEPRNIQWARPKTDDRDTPQRTITAVLSQKSILMFELGSKKTPLELVFEQKYGKIIDYSLFGDGYIVVAFTEGYVAHISTHMKELRDEISSERIFQSTLDALTTNDVVYKMAVAGEGMIKVYNLATWKELKQEKIDLPKNIGKIDKLSWSNNGQLLVVATITGQIIGYLTSIPFVTSSFLGLTAVLSSFTEVTINDTSKPPGTPPLCNISLENEPGFLTLGPYHIAAGINNIVWYYLWLDRQRNGIVQDGQLLLRKDYMGSVKQISLNSQYAAVLSDGKCFLHPIAQQQQGMESKEKKFPTTENEKPLYQIQLTKDFLIMLDSAGKIKYYHLEDMSFVIEFKPEQCLVTRFFCNISGTRSICFDNKGQTYLFEASTENFLQISQFPQKAEKVMWDQQDTNLFIVLESDNLFTYLINKNNIQGVLIEPVKELLSIENINQSSQPVVTILDRGVIPLSVKNGFLKYFTPTGAIQGQNLTSHSYISNYKGSDDNQEGHYRYFLQNFSLRKFNNCLFAAQFLNNNTLLEVLGNKALEFVELDVAIKAFQMSKNLSKVMTIKSFQHENEKNLIFGNVAMILGQYDLAQELFIKSTQPQNALEMRCDIQDYLIALNLAKNIAPQQEPYICKRLALQIESQGNSTEARKLYERAVLNKDERPSENSKIEAHNLHCFAGIARTSIKMGDIPRGFSIAQELQDNNIVIEIAVVCENMKQLNEAAELYEKAGMLEKAASLYIQLKSFKQAGALMSKINSRKILTQYAKSKESEGAYKEAEKFYEKAEDWENVVRLNLNQLDNFDKAKAILRNKCNTSTVSGMVAAVCEKKGLKAEAIEFLIMAGKKEEAFVMAQANTLMDDYVEHMKDTFTVEERMRVAQFYEGQSEWLKAAVQYDKSNNTAKSLKLYFKAGEELIDDMIQLVARNKQQESLVQSLLDYLMGEADGNPKDPKYLLKFYFTVGNIKAATSIALTIATDEQDQGNYKVAHSLLVETYQKIREYRMQVPFDLEQKLMILHSYMLVRRIAKIEDHEGAAWILNRVCLNISQFPAHMINIMTSAVIEAIRANNKPLAYKWALELVRPENRSQISEKYKAKIENIARKPERKEPEESKTDCPFCKEMVPEYQLNCKRCLNQIPFCIASGKYNYFANQKKHVIASEICFCPECKFPANISYFKKLLSSEKTCPLCNKEIDVDLLKEAGDGALAQLKNLRQSDRPSTASTQVSEQSSKIN